jgi:hypothetical protein
MSRFITWAPLSVNLLVSVGEGQTTVAICVLPEKHGSSLANSPNTNFIYNQIADALQQAASRSFKTARLFG